MKLKQLRKRLSNNFGKPSKLKYQPEDMESIKEYLYFRKTKKLDPFLVDDITANDLQLDQVFQQINMGLSTSGEQVLYYLLKRPCETELEHQERASLIELMNTNEKLRVDLSVLLAKLGRNRKAKVCRTFNAGKRNPLYLIAYMALAFGLIGSIATLFIAFSQTGVFATLFFVIANSMIREWRKRGMYTDFETVNYSVSMVVTAHRIRKINDPKLQAMLNPLDESFKALKSMKRVGGVSLSAGNGIAEVLSNYLLIDLITYEILKNTIGQNSQHIFKLHEFLGRIEAAIAIASFQKQVENCCVPAIDYSATTKPFIESEALCHPLLKDCVPNSFKTEKAIILTGSNASGKSTFLKTIALNQLLAQTICTTLAKSYSASSFRIYSSMAISDDLLAGESYYISEIKSLKRVLMASELDKRILCVIDEVLRGTNTIERIAASTQILKALNKEMVLPIAATHDLELCNLLSSEFEAFHFQEEVDENEMLFDYKLREGAATSRNAIKLLKLMGFKQDIVDAADQTAGDYLITGKWDKPN
jgi:Mismatch repair ATPase (MutS family)